MKEKGHRRWLFRFGSKPESVPIDSTHHSRLQINFCHLWFSVVTFATSTFREPDRDQRLLRLQMDLSLHSQLTNHKATTYRTASGIKTKSFVNEIFQRICWRYNPNSTTFQFKKSVVGRTRKRINTKSTDKRLEYNKVAFCQYLWCERYKQKYSNIAREHLQIAQDTITNSGNCACWKRRNSTDVGK